MSRGVNIRILSGSRIGTRPRGSSAERCYFLRQEKVTKECFPQGRASRAFAADFGELQFNKNQCFEFAEPRALQAPLASPHYYADGRKRPPPSRYGSFLPNLNRETGNGWRLKSRTSCTRLTGARGTSPSLRKLPPEFDQRNGIWVETQKPHIPHTFNGSARDKSLAEFRSDLVYTMAGYKVPL